MPNGKPHLDGHLSVGATEAGHRRHQAMSADTIQLVSARDDGPDDDGETVPADSYQDPCKLAELC
jgi:hypothetical protein